MDPLWLSWNSWKTGPAVDTSYHFLKPTSWSGGLQPAPEIYGFLTPDCCLAPGLEECRVTTSRRFLTDEPSSTNPPRAAAADPWPPLLIQKFLLYGLKAAFCVSVKHVHSRENKPKIYKPPQTFINHYIPLHRQQDFSAYKCYLNVHFL